MVQDAAALADRLSAERGGKSPWALAWERFRRKRLAMASLVVVTAFYVLGALAPVLAPGDSYRVQDLDNPDQLAWLGVPYCALVAAIDPNYRPPSSRPPSPEHPLGTDRLGRDVMARILHGMKTSVVVSLAAILTGSIFIGVTLGALAAYYRGWVDALIMRVGEIFLAFPGLLLVVLISATIRPRVKEWAEGFEQAINFRGLVESGFVDYLVVFGALAAFSWVGVARIIRGQILQIREMDYITAARASGATTGRIILHHVMPNTLNIVIYLLSVGLGGAIGSELVLSWLGVGVQPPIPSLGVMIWENGGQTNFINQVTCQRAPLLLAPIAVSTVVFFAFALLGDGLIDALNPRAKDRPGALGGGVH